MWRSAWEAEHARNDISRYHHLTETLLFGISTLESFLNHQMRVFMADRKTDDTIIDVQRNTHFPNKIKTWPSMILGNNLSLSNCTLKQIFTYNTIRGNLIHPKSSGHDIYKRLEGVLPSKIVNTINEFCICFLATKGEIFPYWLFGWNYFNPRAEHHEIWKLNNQQFLFSLQYLGISTGAGIPDNEVEWQNTYMSSYKGYLKVSKILNQFENCEPKLDEYPLKPILCRMWWDREHEKTCGFSSMDT